MEVKSVIDDKKVQAKSILIEIEVGQYLDLGENLVKSNPFQRKRVRGSKTVYSLLKSDILDGCVIPPIVLAYTKEGGDFENAPDIALAQDQDHFSLLDGLQRTYTLLDLRSEISDDPNRLNEFLSRKIRCEVYEGINRLGILYRMLTLNTGQTAMSLRHQVEIMYLDFLNIPIENITLLREVNGGKARSVSTYNFKETIDGFNAYIERSESPLDRGDVLDNISSLENLAKENKDSDLFRDFVKSWDRFILKINSLNLKMPEDEEALQDNDDDADDSKRIWGVSGLRAFKRPQVLSGFGAAIGLLRDDDVALSFDSLDFADLRVGDDPEDFMISINSSIESINSRAKRIGNAQRLFFRQFFKMLLWRDSGCYMNLAKAQDEAYKSSVKIGI
ncbi:hypothetical protein [Stenotrophomonas maltophilia]|uniref:hypothetical protein n=1 Tax=Stenotrophomonas maltophilia TaxID=40324 RepID=UPI0021C7F82F|nr:hypothetical protein [Stenotrophomonas maltophilia]MCU1135815.1 hypothetical protein [Stenotrophomonas maltophilia]